MGTSLATGKEGRFRSGRFLDELFGKPRNPGMEQEFLAEVRGRLKEARLKAGLTQQDVADLLGVTLGAYQHYEGKRVPLRRVQELADVLGTDARWLLHGGDGQLEPAKLEQRVVEVQQQLAEVLDLLARLESRSEAH